MNHRPSGSPIVVFHTTPFHCVQQRAALGFGGRMGRAQRPNTQALRRDGEATDGHDGLHAQMPRLLPARRGHPLSSVHKSV
jgi:hypothetical protein